MKKTIIALCTIAVLTGAWYVDYSPVYEPNILLARKKSEEKRIPYVLFFGAEWASPSQWMEKFTFSDPELQNYISSHYSAVKLDIDAFEGFALKEQYQVKTLPTTIVFDHEHRLLARYEDTYEPQQMLEILQWHSSGRIERAPIAARSKGEMVTNQSTKRNPTTRTTARQTQTAHTSTPTRTNTHTAGSTSTNRTTSNGTPLTRPVQQQTRQTTTRRVVQTQDQSYKDFTIQVGAFSTRASAERMRSEMISKSNGQEVSVREVSHPTLGFRVTVGRFNDEREASTVMFDLDRKGQKGLLKRISTM